MAPEDPAPHRLAAPLSCEEPVAITTKKTSIGVTISIGVATASESADTAETLFKRADLALYRAKNEGRNRVVAAEANGS